ncbi:hypothetical protein NicSoilB11_25960 [Arthrobacter sp. NicSoilB11]|nr:hypothetical protein NicSoilB11_25960 [Arthrobacter sp. NicSoilB11]
MDGAHSGQATVKGNQHVQALGFPHLPYHQPVRTHPQRFLDQATEWNFALTFEVRLPALQTHHVPERKLKFKDLLDRDDTLPATYARRQTVQHGCLACLGGPRHKDVEATGHRCAEKSCRLRCQRSQLDQVFQSAGLHDEFADVHGPVPAGYIRNDYVEPGSVRQCRVHKRGRHVQPPAGAFEHAFYEVTHVLLGEAQRGQL